jgi:hypothetical protein
MEGGPPSQVTLSPSRLSQSLVQVICPTRQNQRLLLHFPAREEALLICPDRQITRMILDVNSLAPANRLIKSYARKMQFTEAIQGDLGRPVLL